MVDVSAGLANATRTHQAGHAQHAADQTGQARTPEQAAAAAREFEAVFLAQMLNHMFAGVDLSNGPFGGGPGERAFKALMVDEYAKLMTRAGGVGIADTVMRTILDAQEGR